MPHSRCNEHPSRNPLFKPFPALTSKIPDTERIQYLSTSPLLLPLLLFGDPVLLYHPNTCPFYLRVPRRCSICGVVFFAHGLDHGMIDVHCALPASGQCISPGLGLNISPLLRSSWVGRSFGPGQGWMESGFIVMHFALHSSCFLWCIVGYGRVYPPGSSLGLFEGGCRTSCQLVGMHGYVSAMQFE